MRRILLSSLLLIAPLIHADALDNFYTGVSEGGRLSQEMYDARIQATTDEIEIQHKRNNYVDSRLGRENSYYRLTTPLEARIQASGLSPQQYYDQQLSMFKSQHQLFFSNPQYVNVFDQYVSHAINQYGAVEPIQIFKVALGWSGRYISDNPGKFHSK